MWRFIPQPAENPAAAPLNIQPYAFTAKQPAAPGGGRCPPHRCEQTNGRTGRTCGSRPDPPRPNPFVFSKPVVCFTGVFKFPEKSHDFFRAQRHVHRS
jgi:hypothetical protein